MLAASEASAEAAIQLPAIGADGWDDGLPRAESLEAARA